MLYRHSIIISQFLRHQDDDIFQDTLVEAEQDGDEIFIHFRAITGEHDWSATMDLATLREIISLAESVEAS